MINGISVQRKYEHDDHLDNIKLQSAYLSSIDDRQALGCPGGQRGLRGEDRMFNSAVQRG